MGSCMCSRLAVAGKTCRMTLPSRIRPAIGDCWNISGAVWQKMVGELLKEADRRGLLNLNNAYHDASVIKSKRGRKVTWAIRENTGFPASNATW